MGVFTTFDEKRESAKQKIGEAINDLHICLKEETWGYEQMKPEFIDELIQMVAELTKIKRRL